MKRPNSAANLIRAIKMYCGVNQDDIRLARAMADVIVGQMLPDGVVKGGSSLMFRYGGAVTRYTKDVDTARLVELEAYLESLRLKLAEGWNGFTGKIVDVELSSPPNVPKPYLMMPYDIKLQYLGKSWMTVRIEVGHNEIGDADAFETMLPDDIVAAFVDLGFPKPNEIPVMKLSYQVAQKLHAVSGINSDRAHDLIDLQLIDKYSILDLVDVRSKCERLFKYRCEQAWPPVIIKGDRWSSVYNEAYTTLRKPEMVLSAVDDAIEWVNEFVNRIVKA